MTGARTKKPPMTPEQIRERARGYDAKRRSTPEGRAKRAACNIRKRDKIPA